MEVRQTNIESIKSGIYTGFGLIIYFLIMKAFDLHKVVELHYLNIFILFIGLRNSLKRMKLFEGEIKYLEGLKIGLIVSMFSILIFNFFMLFYELVIDRAFLSFLQEKISFGYPKSPEATALGVFGLILLEGLSTGFILTYILMQYYKTDSSESN